ncbi:MAG TPA: PKD domain-containing protein, partial [Thermoanaerobaculia bacterium]
ASLTEKVKFGLLGVEKPTSVNFTFGGTTPIIGVPITFTATATAPASYPVTTWQWSFGDGVTASGNPVTHAFSTEGTWSVTLTASNAGGSAPPVTKSIKVLKANAFTYLLPVVSHLNGANGSKWRTDLQIYNSNVGEGPVELEFELTNLGLKKTFRLNTSTLIYEDFMSFFTDADTAGPVIVRGAATHDLQIWTRTYSVGPSGIGTYGHLIPAVRIDGDQRFTAGETILYMTGVSATPKYRSNIYLLNLTSQPMPVTITAYEGQVGAAVGQYSQSVAPFQLTPVSASQITGVPTDKPFSVAIKGTSDGLIAYESVVDNGSNDPIYIPAVATADLADVAMKTQVVPSIGHFQAWRSDVTVFNPDDQAVQFDLAFYDSTGALKAEAKDKLLPAKGLLQLDDILRSEAMNIAEDVIGTLRLNVDSPLADHFPVIAQRNYNDSGDQKRFGQGILGFAAADANVKPGKPAIIPAVRNDQLYKSNVGVVNVGATDATIQLTLLDQATGQPVGIFPITLKPNESRIIPEAIPNPGVFNSAADRGSIKVEVTNDASVWAFAAIIDRATNDPEYVPAIPLD